MQYETIHQQSSIRTPFADVLTQQGIIPGIKVDMARNALRARRPRTSRKASMGYAIGYKDYAQMGARFGQMAGR